MIVLAPLIYLAKESAAEDGKAPSLAAGPTFVGRQACQSCHAEATERWTGSDHDLAMDPATPDNVLGDFDDAEIDAHGVRSRFFRRDGQFMVQTDGPDGTLQDYPIRYTFGWYPLQQYLIPFPDGRLHALSIAWDTRPADRGGQRWFHLYPDERITPGDPLHWTGRYQTWNAMCAECHSTNLQKRYDPDSDSYATTWTSIDVGCEACHGPGAAHAGPEDPADPPGGLLGLLGEGLVEADQRQVVGIGSGRGPRTAPESRGPGPVRDKGPGDEMNGQLGTTRRLEPARIA